VLNGPSRTRRVLDLLAYRRAFNQSLTPQDGIYGIGIAWGEKLMPA
jgi:hypothetical protein